MHLKSSIRNRGWCGRKGVVRRLRCMKAKDLDKKFDSGEDITEFLDISHAKRPGLDQKRVNVDFPVWMIHSLDKEKVHYVNFLVI
jgi:hypothetical protein